MSRGEDETRGVYFRCKVVSLSLESVAVMTFLDVLRCDHCAHVRMHVKAPKETLFCRNSPISEVMDLGGIALFSFVYM